MFNCHLLESSSSLLPSSFIAIGQIPPSTRPSLDLVRMWHGMLKTVTFWNKTTSTYTEARQKREATIKLQSLFRKQLFKTRGPATIRTMILAKRALLPKLKRARERIAVKSSDQLLLFLQDLKQLGGVRFAIRRFKKQNIFTQRLFRSHLIITRQRMSCLTKLWCNAEKIRHLKKIEDAKQKQNERQGRIVAQEKQDELRHANTTQQQTNNRNNTETVPNTTTKKKNKLKTKNERDLATEIKRQNILKEKSISSRRNQARKFVGQNNSSNLKRIEKHVHAMEEAEEIVKEAIATRIPRIPTHIRRTVLREYLQERRREHIRKSAEEDEHHMDIRKKDVGEGMFCVSDMRELLLSNDIENHPLILQMGKRSKRVFQGLLLLTGNSYKHDQRQRRADEDMQVLIEQGILMANEWNKKEKKKQTDGSASSGNLMTNRIKDSEVKEVMRRSSVVGTSNAAMRADYLKAMLEENVGQFR